jgi:heparan-alpha-glucosaminide N-acetyltransferase
LTILAYYYRGGENGDVRFASQWWGILGLIGWAYLAGALVTVFSRNNFYMLLSAWIFFCVLSMVNKAGLIPGSYICIYPKCYFRRYIASTYNGRGFNILCVQALC